MTNVAVGSHLCPFRSWCLLNRVDRDMCSRRVLCLYTWLHLDTDCGWRRSSDLQQQQRQPMIQQLQRLLSVMGILKRRYMDNRLRFIGYIFNRCIEQDICSQDIRLWLMIRGVAKMIWEYM